MNIRKLTSLSVCAGLILGVFTGCSTNEDQAETSASTEVSQVETSAAITEVTETSSLDVEVMETTEFNEVVVIDANLQQHVNTFITNFVEQSFPDYDRDTSSIEQVLDFIHIYLKINSPSSISYENNGDLAFETFTSEDVQRVASRYLGVLVTEDNLSGFPLPPESYGDQPAGPYFADGKVWYEAADGESHNQIGIVNSITNPGDGTLNVEFTVYAIDIETYLDLSADDIRAYYSLTPEQAEADSTLSFVCTGFATVGAAQSGDYYLIMYSVCQ